jgi:hypothetical protein
MPFRKADWRVSSAIAGPPALASTALAIARTGPLYQWEQRMLSSITRTACRAAATHELNHHKFSRHITGRRFGKSALASVSVAAMALAGVVITAPEASAATGCITRTFGYSNTYQQCVLDLQVLLNDLYGHIVGPNQILATDGYYGNHTASDVASWNSAWNPGTTELAEMSPTSWDTLCGWDQVAGFTGAYYRNAGCATR